MWVVEANLQMIEFHRHCLLLLIHHPIRPTLHLIRLRQCRLQRRKTYLECHLFHLHLPTDLKCQKFINIDNKAYCISLITFQIILHIFNFIQINLFVFNFQLLISFFHSSHCDLCSLNRLYRKRSLIYVKRLSCQLISLLFIHFFPFQHVHRSFLKSCGSGSSGFFKLSLKLSQFFFTCPYFRINYEYCITNVINLIKISLTLCCSAVQGG